MQLRVASLLLVVALTTMATGQARQIVHAHGQTADVLSDIAPEVSIAPVAVLAATQRENVTTSTDGRYVAFTTSADVERLFVEDRFADVTYEIAGIPLPHRPFSNLSWTRHRLAFDRLSQPRHGLHYEVDMTTRTLIVARVFRDQ